MPTPARRVGALALTALLATATYFLLPDHCPDAARRMAVIFVIAALFWSTSIVPSHATSFAIVLLEIVFLTKAEGVHASTFLNPFSQPIIFLFLGGFSLAGALHKYHLDKKMTERLLPLFGKNPFSLLLGLMLMTAFFACWMSATATTATMLTLIQPLLSQLDKEDPFRKTLVLSIPMSARVGGLCTPVGTPPNAIALGLLEEHGIHVGFVSWMAMGVPLAMILMTVTAFLLYRFFPPRQTINQLHLPPNEPVGRKGRFVLIVSGVTVVMWLSSGWHKIPEAVVALGAMAVLYGSRLLDRHDLKQLDWDIVVLMWGGLALGEGMELSGLTAWVVDSPLFHSQGFVLIALICVFAMGLSTFMSNTAAANLLVPVAISLPSNHPTILVIAVALACSFDIPFPISSPPNALAFGTHEVEVKDMLKAGTPVTLLAILLIIVAAYVASNTITG